MNTRSRAILTGVVMASLMSVASCSSNSPDDSKDAKPQSKEQAACDTEPKPGGSLTYARTFETLTLDPIAVRNGNGDIFADALIYEGLVRYDPKGSADIVPAISDTWDVSPDGMTYTFHIREGVKFSDGSPVTAEDVKFSLDRFGDPDINQVLGNLAEGYGSSTIVGDDTVEISLTQPVPSFLDNIAVFPAFVVPKKLVEEQGDAFWKNPVGSGPYKVKDFVGGSRLELTRNENYWDPGKPYIDDVTFNFATDSNSRLLSLESGEAQMADGIEPAQIGRVNDNDDLSIKAEQVPQWIALYMNQKRPEFADKKVRQAINTVIDREAINEQIFEGLGVIPNSIFTHFAYDAPESEVPPFETSVEKAKQLMAESGFPDGFETELTFPAGTEYFNQVSLAVQQQLAEIGIDVELNKLDPATMVDDWREEGYGITYSFPGITSDVAVPDEFASFYGIPATNNGWHTNWKNAEVEAKVKEFISTPDDVARAEQWPVLQKLFNEEVPSINVLNLPFFVAHSTKVCGSGVNVLGIDQLQEAWVVQ